MAAEFTERVGARITKRREEMGLSKAEVARRMAGNVDANQLRRWEKGQHQPQPDSLEELARVLECDVSYFMVPEPEPETGDLLDVLTERSQLDRIEEIMGLILKHLEGDEDQAP